jgi:hypothetical protein
MKCPNCGSKDTEPYIATNLQGTVTSMGHVCNNCDESWEKTPAKRKDPPCTP